MSCPCRSYPYQVKMWPGHYIFDIMGVIHFLYITSSCIWLLPDIRNMNRDLVHDEPNCRINRLPIVLIQIKAARRGGRNKWNRLSRDTVFRDSISRENVCFLLVNTWQLRSYRWRKWTVRIQTSRRLACWIFTLFTWIYGLRKNCC